MYHFLNFYSQKNFNIKDVSVVSLCTNGFLSLKTDQLDFSKQKFLEILGLVGQTITPEKHVMSQLQLKFELVIILKAVFATIIFS